MSASGCTFVLSRGTHFCDEPSLTLFNKKYGSADWKVVHCAPLERLLSQRGTRGTGGCAYLRRLISTCPFASCTHYTSFTDQARIPVGAKSNANNNQLVIPREGNLIGSDMQIATMPDRGDLQLFIGVELRYQQGLLTMVDCHGIA